MMGLGENADIKLWHLFLTEECGLALGQDWQWGWKDNAWAVEFNDPRMEVHVHLKMRDDS